MSEVECENEFKKEMKNWHRRGGHHGSNGGNGVYCLGFIGAAVYFIGGAATFGAGVVGFLKAIVWPAFLVYEALKVLIK